MRDSITVSNEDIYEAYTRFKNAQYPQYVRTILEQSEFWNYLGIRVHPLFNYGQHDW